ncbi:MAG: sugar phosphorylase [Desulfobacteraceae bacterium]|nr:sugar phosphorylase [Desulfobacteraceae bacterium]
MKDILKKVYGTQKGEQAFERINSLLEKFPARKRQHENFFSQQDVVMITYGDSLIREGETPLNTLHSFADKYLKDALSTIHILPFFPFSSDDGFSVIDFFSINPDLGSWEDIKSVGKDFQLMFDLVLNHISAKSEWFQNYLDGKQGFEELAIEADPCADLSMVTRPRSLPLLTEFKKSSGETAHVWTTFSEDQIDLNYESIDVLEKMVQALLYYVEQGATAIRLDAIAYLWKELGTNCIHLSQVHDIVKLFRKIFDRVAPDVIIITETNVPHDENISYFGNGSDEAQMVYNFTLPPLLFYSFTKEDSTILSEWAKGLHLKSADNTFFNFTASHDGIGVRPLEGILPKEEIDRLIEIVRKNGGNVSYKKNSDGTESPYELNITYVDALLDSTVENDPYHAQRFLAAQSIQFALPGVPAAYIHSILGSRNWNEGVRQTGRARTINREKLNADQVMAELENAESFRSGVFYQYTEMIKIRRKQQAFHPNSDFEILDINPGVFALKRHCESQTIYALTNITSKNIQVSLSEKGGPTEMKDIVSGKIFSTNLLSLDPYQFVWLEASG